MVPHHGTNRAALWLTAQIRRDAVLSEPYGRGCGMFSMVSYVLLCHKDRWNWGEKKSQPEVVSKVKMPTLEKRQSREKREFNLG